MKKYTAGLILSGIFVFIGGCQMNMEQAMPVLSEKSVESVLLNAEGQSVGTALMKETAEGVSIHLQAKNIEPGEKAVHIHEKGSCVPPDFESAGGHFNPEKKQHGFNNPKGFHAGDLSNLEVDADGTINLSLTVKAVTLEKGSPHSLLDEDGSAIVIHEKADDYHTDPAGNAGKRIVCGEIKGS
ncbi:superoxide dismutase family protein [Jeotgalibacillus sp. R-1-5s-1]|uniref:superoxide dismutase family protein n=1 Tax=Jeotgalibacillus sp. R-1-5s-1 TaxID=2555897 RepID=UPI00106B6B00|nr:superoxide dismutase family protein [Jeotgalibacillus sp. R-1-5s-1]